LNQKPDAFLVTDAGEETPLDLSVQLFGEHHEISVLLHQYMVGSTGSSAINH
jgi:hypothetical protein